MIKIQNQLHIILATSWMERVDINFGYRNRNNQILFLSNVIFQQDFFYLSSKNQNCFFLSTLGLK